MGIHLNNNNNNNQEGESEDEYIENETIIHLQCYNKLGNGERSKR